MKASENPFRSEAVAKLRYRMPPQQLAALANQVVTQTRQCSIVGPHGTGKSTLLEDLQPHLTQHGLQIRHHYLNVQTSRQQRHATLKQIKQANYTPNQCTLLDGGEVLGPFQWRQLLQHIRQHNNHLITTLHRPRKLPILHKTQTDWATAQELIQQLTHHDLEHIAHTAFKQNQGNIREVFRACYWACARLETNPKNLF